MPQKMLTPIELQERLGYQSLSAVYQLSSSGKIAKYKIGKKVFFAEPDVDDFVQSCRIEGFNKNKGGKS